MDISPALQSLEASLKGAGIGVNDFCGELGIHRATWQRWKAGDTSPTLRQAEAIVSKAKKHGVEFGFGPIGAGQ